MGLEFFGDFHARVLGLFNRILLIARKALKKKKPYLRRAFRDINYRTNGKTYVTPTAAAAAKAGTTHALILSAVVTVLAAVSSC